MVIEVAEEGGGQKWLASRKRRAVLVQGQRKNFGVFCERTELLLQRRRRRRWRRQLILMMMAVERVLLIMPGLQRVLLCTLPIELPVDLQRITWEFRALVLLLVLFGWLAVALKQ